MIPDNFDNNYKELNYFIDFQDPMLYGNEAADDEKPEFLDGYFVAQEKFKKFAELSNNFMIVMARKGVGKSALIKKTAYDWQKNDNILTICINGSDLSIQRKFAQGNTHELIFDWQQRICYRINVEIGKEIGFAISNPNISLVEASELSGFKNKNLIGCLLERLQFKIGGFEAIKTNNSAAIDNQQLIKNYLENNKKKIVCILIDDIDATFRNTAQERELLSTFFTACRELVSSVDGVRIRSSVRSDVWTSIRISDEALDKCQQYIMNLNWSHNGTLTILSKRIRCYLDSKINKLSKQKVRDKYKDYLHAIKTKEIIELVFDDESYENLHLLSAGRPRWALQLFRLAANATIKVSNRKKIKESNINNIMYQYGMYRFQDILSEHMHQCEKTESLIYSFLGKNTNYSSLELLEHLKHVLFCEKEVIIDNTLIDSPIDIANFLFRCGFIFARDIINESHHVHYYYDNRPHLLKNKYSLQEDFIWSIHPLFWKYLRLKDKINEMPER